VGIYLIGQAAELVIDWGISYKTRNRNISILELYLIGQATERVEFWGYI